MNLVSQISTNSITNARGIFLSPSRLLPLSLPAGWPRAAIARTLGAGLILHDAFCDHVGGGAAQQDWSRPSTGVRMSRRGGELAHAPTVLQKNILHVAVAYIFLCCSSFVFHVA